LFREGVVGFAPSSKQMGQRNNKNLEQNTQVILANTVRGLLGSLRSSSKQMGQRNNKNLEQNTQVILANTRGLLGSLLPVNKWVNAITKTWNKTLKSY
jgi:hypothetical protein